ncbi:MAG: aromatic amino acid lyase, partial [Solirubrobacterales bacterium]|nr:aromatic amino acid lyase [Solirubrobacterales bacterium]
MTLELGAGGVSFADVVAVARGAVVVSLGVEALAAMERSAAVVAALAASDEPAYGISTGFGSLALVSIPADLRVELQRALVRSHAAGMGPPIEREVVRAMMLLRARTLAMGYSGARPVVAERILALLAAGITPVVPEYGSLGASGDLAPLAHCALVLIGEGEVFDAAGRRVLASEALGSAGIEPLELTVKEGLALINGTDGMLGMLVLALADLGVLLRTADVAAAMSVEALLGTDRAFAEDLIALRPQPGQVASASNLRALLAGSSIVASHRYGDPRVQDAYSLRCAPQVIGAGRDALEFARGVASVELRSAIDNPMVLPDGRVESCGNFHGAPVGMACDFLAVAAAEVGAIAERRTDRLLDAARSHGLPPFLAA